MNHRPRGPKCVECGRTMEAGAWAVARGAESVTWAQCEECDIGWGPFTGYVDIDDPRSEVGR